VFETAKTITGYASTPITVIDFNRCTSGPATPMGGLIADANGNLFGTSQNGSTNFIDDTVFEIAKTATGYAVPHDARQFQRS
jgi:hypothetical protein